MRQVLFGIIWTVVIYFAACVITGAVAGGIAGGNDPQHASQAGASAGAQAVAAIRIYLFFGALALGTFGAWVRFLPGTRRPSPDRA